MPAAAASKASSPLRPIERRVVLLVFAALLLDLLAFTSVCLGCQLPALAALLPLVLELTTAPSLDRLDFCSTTRP